jgi:hypothetical protein
MFENVSVDEFVSRAAEHYDMYDSITVEEVEEDLRDRVQTVSAGSTSAYVDFSGKVGRRTVFAVKDAFDAEVSGMMSFGDLSAPGSPNYDNEGVRVWFTSRDDDGGPEFDEHVADQLASAYDESESSAVQDVIETVLADNGYEIVEETIVFAERTDE